MKYAVLLLTLRLFAANLVLTPPVVFDCAQNSGMVTVTWSGATGPVQVRLLRPDGPSMTGVSDPSGSAVSGGWVTDGMQFYLVNQTGGVEASATARVRCAGTTRTIDQGLNSGSYFPLQVGNVWVYRTNSRAITNDYVIRSISGTEVIQGQTYFVLTSTYQGNATVTARLRGDNNGVIRQWTGTEETVYLDPALATGPAPFTSLLGKFDSAVTLSTRVSLSAVTSIFVRGIGLVNSQSTIIAGSSGGFGDSLDLVEVRVDGITLSLPSAKLNLSIESVILDLTNRIVPNCALPCYFTACTFAFPVPDPPGTYRPCTQTRIESSFTGPHSLQLQFFNPSGTLVYDTTSAVDSVSALSYLRLPLYTTNISTGTFQVLPTGIYKLVARMLASGVEIGVDSLVVRVQ